MAKPLLTVVTVNYNTSDFVELLIYSLSKLTCNTYKLIVCDNGSAAGDIAKLNRLSKSNAEVELIFRRQCSSASIAHGRALDLLIAKSESKYTVVLDSDCVFLLQGWDVELVKSLAGGVKIIGSTSPFSRSGIRFGGGDFPLPFAALFETDTYKSLDISCVPGDVSVGQDTCWQWREKFSRAGFSGLTFGVRNTRDHKSGLFSDIVGVEEYYLFDGRLVAAHFGRGASFGAAKYLKWFKVPLFSTLLKRQFGKWDKRRWIKRCYGIIDSQ